MTTDTYTPPLGESQVHEVERNVEWLVRSLNDKAKRLDNASEAGSRLAAAVCDYLADPEGIGTGYIEKARYGFLQAHSGGFLTSGPTE